MKAPTRQQIARIVRTALEEDTALGDATTAALLSSRQKAQARIVAGHPLIVAGVAVAKAVFAAVDPAIRVMQALEDGAEARPGEAILTLQGDARSVLMAERTALNFLQRLSGIATLTGRYCAAVRAYPTRILDTRKTTPGLRVLEKWAVRLGGGLNHRQSLGDGILIKDNHRILLRAKGRSLREACRLARDRSPHGLRIIAEADTLSDVREALAGQADVILLDNMTVTQVRDAVALIKGRAVVEVSGGVTLDRAPEYAAAGADFLSVGALTHSAPAADFSLEIVPEAAAVRPRRRIKG